MISSRRALTLGFYPTSRGFGWIAFESPLAPYDWGLCVTKPQSQYAKNAQCLKSLTRILTRLAPETLVLEAFDPRSAMRSARIQKLCKSLLALAAQHGIEVVIYTRKDITRAFAPLGAVTREEIAAAVARTLPELRPRLPAARKPWQSEDRRLALFGAAALVLTHYADGANQVFEDLKRAS